MVNPNKKIPDKIPCPTDAHWQYEFEKIRERLELVEGEDTWDKIEAGVATLNAVVRGGAYRFESFVPTIREYSKQLCGAMLSERGRLSSTAVELCSNIAHGLGNNFKPLVPIIVPALIDLCRRPNKIVLTRAQACLTDVVCMTHCSDILRHLRTATKDKSVQLRKACADATLKAIQKWGVGEIGKRVEDVEDIIKAIGRDPGPDVRKVAKEIYEIYSTTWPERLRDFNAPLTPVTRKYLGVTAASAVVYSDSEAIAPPLLKRSASTRSLAAPRPRSVAIAYVPDAGPSSSAAPSALAFPTRVESPAQVFQPVSRVRNGGLVANAGLGVGIMSKRFEAIRNGGRIQNRLGHFQDPAAPVLSFASRDPSPAPAPANAPFQPPARSASAAALRDAITALDNEAEKLHVGDSAEPVERPPSRPASAMSRPRTIFLRQEEQPAQRPRVISIPTRPNSVLQHHMPPPAAPARSLPPVESQTQTQVPRPASRAASNNSSSRPASVASFRPPSRLEQTMENQQRKRLLVDVPVASPKPQQRPRVIHLPTPDPTSCKAGPEDPRRENLQKIAFAPVKGNVMGADIPEKKVPSKRLAAIKQRLLTAEEIEAMQQVHEAAKTLSSGSAPTDSADATHKSQPFPSTNPAPTVSVPVKAQVSQEARPTARTRVNSAATAPTQVTAGAGTSTGFVPKRGIVKPNTAAAPSKTSNSAGPSATAASQLSGSKQTTTTTKPEQGPVPRRGRTVSNAPRPAWGSGRSNSAKPGERQRTTSTAAALAPVIVAKAREALSRRPPVPAVPRTANGGTRPAVSATTTTAIGRPMLKKSTSMASLSLKDKAWAGPHTSVAAKATVASAARARQPFRPVRHKEVEKAAAISLPVTPPPEVIAAAAVALPTTPTIPNLELPPAVVMSIPPAPAPKERATCEIPKGVKVSTQTELSLVVEVSNSAILSTPGYEKRSSGVSKLQEESGGAGKTSRSPLGEIPINAAS